MPELPNTEQEEATSAMEKTQCNSDQAASVDYSQNTVLKVVSIEILDPPNTSKDNNNDTQDIASNSRPVINNEDNELTCTEAPIKPINNKEFPLRDSFDHTKVNKNLNELSKMEQVKSANENEISQGYSDNSSNVKLERMMSLKVILERAEYIGCPNCNLVFFRPKDFKLHSVKHLLPSNAYSDDEDARFVKRFACHECDAKFVQLSTLEAHLPSHVPPPHACHCGIRYHQAKDLAAHKNIVHIEEIRQKLATLTDRQQKAYKNEIWQPNVDYTVKKPKKEPETPASPKVKRRQIAPHIKSYSCEQEKLISQNEDKTFSCPICFKRLKAKGAVKVHLASHAAVKPYQCEVCDKRFTQRVALGTHMKLHTGVKDFKCRFCGKEFVNKWAMLRHVRIHTGEKPYACSFCPQAFSDPSAFARHERTHTGVKPYVCRECGKAFSDASGHIAHLRSHKGTKNYQCDICYKKFPTNYNLRLHLACVHSKEKKHRCKICNKHFALKQYLDGHIKRHKNVKNFECDYCGVRLVSKLSISTHIQSVHFHVKSHQCPECGAKFYAKSVMKKHYNIVHKRLSNFQCDICSKTTGYKGDMVKHLISKHSKVKCEKCSKKFANSAELQKHTEQGCIECVCGKYFPSRKTLDTHKLAHELSSSYLCGFCDSRFKSEYRLKKHFVEVHTNTERYECDDCGKKFSTRSQILSHIHKLHSMVHVYCHICKKRYFSESSLKEHKEKKLCFSFIICEICGKKIRRVAKLKHYQKYHKVAQTFQCDYCSKKLTSKNSLRRHFKLCHKDII